MDKFHPGYFGKVGMRRYHLKRGMSFCPTVNIDRLWSLMPEGVYDKCKSNPDDLTPVIDVTKLVMTLAHVQVRLNHHLQSVTAN
jgi:large subunit ribosomal protein L27Ae